MSCCRALTLGFLGFSSCIAQAQCLQFPSLWSTDRLSILFHWSICLSLYLYHIVLIIARYSLVSGIMFCFILLQDCLVYSWPFVFPNKFYNWFVIFYHWIQLGFDWASQVALLVKNPPASAKDIRDAGSVLGSGRSPGGGHGNQL